MAVVPGNRVLKQYPSNTVRQFKSERLESQPRVFQPIVGVGTWR